MVQKIKVVIPVIIVMLAALISGCTAQPSIKDLTPEQVVNQFWTDIGSGDYEHAYQLSYHANLNQTRQMWLDEHKVKWGENGSFIKIYSLNVTDSTPINSSLFEGNFTDARIINTNATISYLGQNETGQLRMILVNTTDGWKVFGNY